MTGRLRAVPGAPALRLREWPGSELAERHGVSQRTIRRDVDRLRELGSPARLLAFGALSAVSRTRRRPRWPLSRPR